MTKQLENLFFGDEDNDRTDVNESLNLPSQEDVEQSSPTISKQTLEKMDKIDQALTAVRNLDATDSEMDDLAADAKNAFDNLMDLGMQVDSRFSAEIFSSASSMLGHAITAKTAKINKKLRIIDLQLKKAELDRKLGAQAQKAADAKESPVALGTGQVLDRDELIKSILAQAKNADDVSDKK
jgi:hypothetical protein